MADYTEWYVTLSPPARIYRLDDVLPDFASDGADTWITLESLHTSNTIPCIPIEYEILEAMGKCLYVRNIPPYSPSSEIKALFMNYGCVVKCPCIISLNSEEVFRWVVMSTRQEAERALKALHGSRIGAGDREVLGVSWALSPERGTMLVDMDDEETDSEESEEESGEESNESEEQVDEDQNQEENVDGLDMERTPRALMVAHFEGGEVTPKVAMVARFAEGCAAPSTASRDFVPSASGKEPEKSIPAEQRKTPAEVFELLRSFSVDRGTKAKTSIGRPLSTGARGERIEEDTTSLPRGAEFPPLGSDTWVDDLTSEAAPGEANRVIDAARVTELDAHHFTAGPSTTESHRFGTSPAKRLIQTHADKSKDVAQLPEEHIKQLPIPSSSAESHRFSWASVASSSVPGTKVIDLQPRTKFDFVTPRAKTPGRRTLSVQRNNEQTEVNDDSNRVVFLLHLPSNITLQNVSDAITEGPVAKIQFGSKDEDGLRFVGIIFQNGTDAIAFFAALQEERKRTCPSKFRFIVEAEMGEPYYPDELIKAMDPPLYGTRRLTVVKKQFFFMFGEKQLKEFCHRLVGEENVQLIWLYNGGNATVVFADVLAAVKVKKELERKAAQAGQVGGEAPMWEGLTANFSKDPCVWPLQLTTTLHD